jgi:hypothetical protein
MNNMTTINDDISPSQSGQPGEATPYVQSIPSANSQELSNSPTPKLLNSLSSKTFPRFPGETPRAFSAFVAFLQFGHNRSLPAVAKYLGEKHPTIKYWSAKYHWSERINAFNSGPGLDRRSDRP